MCLACVVGACVCLCCVCACVRLCCVRACVCVGSGHSQLACSLRRPPTGPPGVACHPRRAARASSAPLLTGAGFWHCPMAPPHGTAGTSTSCSPAKWRQPPPSPLCRVSGAGAGMGGIGGMAGVPGVQGRRSCMPGLGAGTAGRLAGATAAEQLCHPPCHPPCAAPQTRTGCWRRRGAWACCGAPRWEPRTRC